MDKSKEENLPLGGVKVIDLTRAVAGPVCSMILADMGAEVIRIEEPEQNEDPANQLLSRDAIKLFDRNKKSITLNLRTEKGKDILRRLIKWGDVLVENYRPGVMQKMGLDYPSVREINPRIVMTSISGYGQTGPYAGRAGLDGIGQAMGGLMSVTGPMDSPPTAAGTTVSDISTGIFGALGTTLALYKRNSTGLGQHVESSLMESIVFLMSFSLAKYAVGLPSEKSERKGTTGTGCFLTKDGKYICLAGQNANHFPLLAHMIGRDDLATAPGYKTRAERVEHTEEINDVIRAWTASHNIQEIEDGLDKTGIPFGRVQTVADLMKDPHLKARGRFADLDFYGQMKSVFGPYPVLSDTPGSIRTPIPRLGEHNEQVYGGLLGFSKEEMGTLKSQGII